MKASLSVALFLTFVYRFANSTQVTREVNFTYEAYDDEPGVQFKCTVTGFPHIICIGRLNNPGYLSVQSPHGNKNISTLVHHSPDVNCRFMATYVCSATYSDGKKIHANLDVSLANCGPILCDGEFKNKTVLVGIGETVQVSVCIITSMNVSEASLMASSSYGNCGRTNCPVMNYTVQIKQSVSKIYTNITLKIFNISADMFTMYNLTVGTRKPFMYQLYLKERGKNNTGIFSSQCNRIFLRSSFVLEKEK
ncbi:unnamed protein product [Lymnaea stagnalis]|uniref:Uncharacterized protein n=1 Tax=Lymnaea stagnalis TaxID=6523 RepID=A0AAV2HY46_LYMST